MVEPGGALERVPAPAEHAQDIDVVVPDDVENAIGALRDHTDLQSLGAQDHGARSGESGQLYVRAVMRSTMRSAYQREVYSSGRVLPALLASRPASIAWLMYTRSMTSSQVASSGSASAIRRTSCSAGIIGASQRDCTAESQGSSGLAKTRESLLGSRARFPKQEPPQIPERKRYEGNEPDNDEDERHGTSRARGHRIAHFRLVPSGDFIDAGELPFQPVESWQCHGFNITTEPGTPAFSAFGLDPALPLPSL